jgi:hypothetical protein
VITTTTRALVAANVPDIVVIRFVIWSINGDKTGFLEKMSAIVESRREKLVRAGIKM